MKVVCIFEFSGSLNPLFPGIMHHQVKGCNNYWCLSFLFAILANYYYYLTPYFRKKNDTFSILINASYT